MRRAQVQPQKLGRVEVCALPADGPMQVRAGDAARRSAEAELVANRDVLAFVDVDAAEMHGEREHAQAVIDDDAVAFKVERAREDHDAAIGCAYRRAHRGAEIHALVNAGQLAVEHAARAKAVGRRGSNGRAKAG